MKQKYLYFLLGGIACVVFYILLIGIYTRISKDPIIFFASLIFSVVVSVVVCFVLYRVRNSGGQSLYEPFTIGIIGLVYLMGCILVSVFGPVFIDRSISYHLAFYAVDKEEIYIKEIESAFSTEIFNKRLHDAIATGFLEQQENGSYVPTWKSKFLDGILKPIGKITDSLGTYYQVINEIEMQEVHKNE